MQRNTTFLYPFFRTHIKLDAAELNNRVGYLFYDTTQTKLANTPKLLFGLGVASWV